MKSWFNNIVGSVIDCGINRDLKIEEAQVIRLTNLFGIFPMFFFFIYIVNGIIYNISFFWQIGLINALLNTMAIWCNHKRYYTAAKTLLLASSSLILLLFTNVVSGNASAVTFFFPVLTCYVVFYDIMKEWKTMVSNLAITAGCIICCLLLPEHFFGNVPLPPYMSGNISRLNFMLAFFSFSFYVCLIIKVKLQTETLLIQSAETAEIMANKSDQMVSQLTIQKQRAEHVSRMKSLLLSNMSHDLLAPLNGIIGTTSHLLAANKQRSLDPQLQEISYSSEQMRVLINDYIDYSNLEAGKLKLDRKIFNVRKLSEKIAIMFNQHSGMKGLAFNIELDESLDKEVIGDEEKIIQVIKHLLYDTAKSMLSGYVTLNIEIASATSNVIKVSFAVTATGSATPVFNSAVLGKTGEADTSIEDEDGVRSLGLNISQKLVQLLGGRLCIDPPKARRHCYHFTIPLTKHDAQQAFPGQPKVKTLKAFKGINVLLVEDNKINMLVANKFLSNWQINIKEAVNGKEALDLFQIFSFDLIILDLEMPVMDGYQAIAEIRKLDPSVPVIAFTASVFDNMKNVLLAAGFNDVISKPFRPEELHTKIATYATRA